MYLNKYNEENILILNIESVHAVNKLDNLLKIPGVDAILIGSHDLSCSLGIPEQYENLKFFKIIEKIFKKARTNKIGAGIHSWCDLDHHVKLINMGANMLIHKADITIFIEGIKKEIDYIKKRI